MVQLYIATLVLLALVAPTLWFWRYRRINIGPVLCAVITVGVVAARLAFVLTHLDVYTRAPLSMLDLYDGGLVEVVAMFAAFATAIEATHRSTVLRKPLALTLASAAGAWTLATILTPYFTSVPMQSPATVVRNLNGAPVNLATFRGTPLVINLWASWCPPCRREMPLLDNAQRKYVDVNFIFVNEGEQIPDIRRFLDAERLALRNVYADRLRQVGGATNSIGMPTTLFFNRKGELVARHVGEIDAASLAIALTSL